MEALLIFVTLICGYTFTRLRYTTRYRIARKKDYHLYFMMGSYGFYILILSGFAVKIHKDGYSSIFDLSAIRRAPLFYNENAGIIILFSLALSYSAILFNIPGTIRHILESVLAASSDGWYGSHGIERCWIIYDIIITGADEVKDRHYRESINNISMEKLLYRSACSVLSVSVTLKNEMVYIGWPIGSRYPGEKKSLPLIPLMSGWCSRTGFEIERYYTSVGNGDNGEMIERVGALFDTDSGESEEEYLKRMMSLAEESLVVIPFDEVAAVQLFSIEAYYEMLTGG